MTHHPAHRPSPEIVGFVAAVLRQMDHAADLVSAFFLQVGILPADKSALSALSREFLLELAALLQLREWHAVGVIDWFDPDGLSPDDLLGRAIDRLRDAAPPVAAHAHGTEAMTQVLRIWTETLAPDARCYLDADVAIRWDESLDLDVMINTFATFLCRHRNATPNTETD